MPDIPPTPNTRPLTIICTGKLAGTTVGHIDHFMGYAVGLMRLGHEVYVMDNVGSGRCFDEDGKRVRFEEWNGRQKFEAMAKSYGIWPRCCLISKDGRATHGMTFADAVKVAGKADLLLTRSGQIRVDDILEAPQTRAYIDGNPGSTQYFLDQSGGDFDRLDRYEYVFTMGLNVSKIDSRIPTAGRTWHPIMRPVVMPMWPDRSSFGGKRFTTISSWIGRTTFELNGIYSGEKSDSWTRFIELPKYTDQEMEIALRILSADSESDADVFPANGWVLTDPGKLRNFFDYRDYIGRSRAEFSVTHNRYVEFSMGWFSDRSALYLASGKPILIQSAGIEEHLPTGEGLLTYTSMDQAIAGIETINSNYGVHCRAARAIAEEYLDSDKVLVNMLRKIGF